jgi:hypothetical protein
LHTLGAVRAGHELASLKPFFLLWRFLAGFATITAAPSLCITRGNQPIAVSMYGFEEIRSHVLWYTWLLVDAWRMIGHVTK